jgi:hypothetical protein
VAALAVLGVALAALAVAYLYLARRRRSGASSPLRAIEAALAAAEQSGEPVSLIRVSLAANGAAPAKPALLCSRLRHADRLCRLDARRFLVVAPDTDQQTAQALASDLRRYAGRAAGADDEGVQVEVRTAAAGANAAELLELISTAHPPLHAPVPSD